MSLTCLMVKNRCCSMLREASLWACSSRRLRESAWTAFCACKSLYLLLEVMLTFLRKHDRWRGGPQSSSNGT